MAKLTEVTRQRDLNLFRSIRQENCDEEVETILKSRFFSRSSDQFPNSALHVFAENATVNGRNQMRKTIQEWTK